MVVSVFQFTPVLYLGWHENSTMLLIFKQTKRFNQMKKFSDLVIRQKRVTSLNHYNDSSLDAFETATEEIIQKFYDDLKVYAIRDEELEKEINDNYAKLQTYESPAQLRLIDEQLDCENQTGYINGYLDSLIEMKVVYLFKSLEITIKYFIKTAYPAIDVKSFFKWENIKEFFRGKDIDISTITGYPQCVELKKINNCIKHNSVINEEIRSIAEFAGQSYLHHEQLQDFYHRVSGSVKNFCYDLKEKIKEDLYTFSDERIDLLATDFHERMDDRALLLFIDKLKAKFNDQGRTGKNACG